MIQRLQAGRRPNRYSGQDDADDWTTPAVTDLPGVYWAPDTPAEQPAVDGQPVIETGTIYGTAHPLDEADRVRIPGVGDFQVSGVRSPARNPFTLQAAGMVVTVRRVR